MTTIRFLENEQLSAEFVVPDHIADAYIDLLMAYIADPEAVTEDEQ